MNSFYVNKPYKYLGEIPEFAKNGLPVGYLINKGKVGCGGTSIALENDKDTVICVPFVSLIKNKIFKYGEKNVLGVYNGITKEYIKEYIDNKVGVKKIMCTYDSLPRLMEVIDYNYFLLVDELHLLFIQYVFRNKAVRGVLDIFRNFKEWAFLTATPIEDDLMLEELKDIPHYNIEWEDKTEIKVNTVQCKQVLYSLSKIIDKFLEGKYFGNAHIFLNSVDSIATLIKKCNLTNDNCRVIWSKNNEKYKNSINGITNSETTDPVKKINIYTSTCFEGCDLFDKEGKIIIVSEGRKSQTLLDISTQVRQIAGRIRDTKYHTITHLYKTTRYNNHLTFDEYKEVVLNEEKKAKSYISKINNDNEIVEGTKESIYPYVFKDEETGKFSFDPNRMKLDIFNYKCLHHTYSLDVNISNEYTNNGVAEIAQYKDNKISDKLLMNESSRTTFKDAIAEYDSIINRKKILDLSSVDNDRLALLIKKYPYIEDAYNSLGMDRIKEMKYHTSNIKRALIVETSKLTNKAKIAKLLKSVEGFSEGTFVTGEKIKLVLQQIYDVIGITDIKASVQAFREYAVLKDDKIRVDGKQIRGYTIQYIKIK